MRLIDPDQEAAGAHYAKSRDEASTRGRVCPSLHVVLLEVEQYRSSSLPSVFRRDRENLIGDPRKRNDDICTTAGNRLLRHAEHDGGGFMFGYGH
jgi:hypothetical protein